MNIAIPVFRSQYLGASDKVTSAPIRCQGNKVVLTVTQINITGTCTSYVDGSYDGISWILGITTPSSVAQTAFGVPTPANLPIKTSLDYAFVRVRAETAAASAALFDATLAFSEQ